MPSQVVYLRVPPLTLRHDAGKDTFWLGLRGIRGERKKPPMAKELGNLNGNVVVSWVKFDNMVMVQVKSLCTS